MSSACERQASGEGCQEGAVYSVRNGSGKVDRMEHISRVWRLNAVGKVAFPCPDFSG